MDKDHNSNICQRLFNFMLSFKNTDPVPPGSIQIAIEDGSSGDEGGRVGPKYMPNGYVGSEVVNVKFLHTHGDGNDKKTHRFDDKNYQDNAYVKGSQGKKGARNNSSDQVKMGSNGPVEDIKPRPGKKPLLYVASDINEKCDEYIKSRREAMSKEL